MIKIREKSVIKPLFFPKNVFSCSEESILVLKSLTTNEEYTFELEDSGNLQDYYILSPDFSNMEDGEYEYVINCNARGLIRIGEVKPTQSQYNGENSGIIYYGED